MPARCRSCDAPIEWCVLNGKRHPVDLKPTPDGRLVETSIVDQDGRHVRTITKANPAPDGAVVRQSHFATCPNADRHRR